MEKKWYYEIRNTRTHEELSTIGKNFHSVITAKGWKSKDCRLVWKCSAEDWERDK